MIIGSVQVSFSTKIFTRFSGKPQTLIPKGRDVSERNSHGTVTLEVNSDIAVVKINLPHAKVRMFHLFRISPLF